MNYFFDLSNKKVWVPGGEGFLGSAIVRRLKNENCEIHTTNRKDIDLRNQPQVFKYVEKLKPDVIIPCAAVVGGIKANMNRPAEFCYDNIAITSNIVAAAHHFDVVRLVHFGSSCMYPRDASQPMCENDLWRGPLEPTNEPYAVAKLAGLTMVQAYRRQYGRLYITVIPTNLYGPGDHYFTSDSHVVASMMGRFHLAKISNRIAEPVWGSGTPRREFLFVDDAADAIIFLIKNYDDSEPINIGGGDSVSIRDLAKIVADTIGYKEEIEFDVEKPDGMPLKALDNKKLNRFGWQPRINFRAGIQKTYADYVLALEAMN